MSKLYLTVGVAGSGKSTQSKDWASYEDAVRLSTDEYRAIYGTGEGDQGVNHQVFTTIFATTEHLLNQNYNVLVDATHYNKKNRKNLIEITRKTNSAIFALYLGWDLSLQTLISRNQTRNRVVPLDILLKQFNGLEKPTLEEFDGIYYINKVGRIASEEVRC